MNKWATKADKLKARVSTNYIFSCFGNNCARVAEAAGVTRKTAAKWLNQGYISREHVKRLIDTRQVNGALKKKDCRPDIESWN